VVRKSGRDRLGCRYPRWRTALSAPRSIKGMLDKVDGKLEAGMSGLFQAPAIA
jgi:hypothetical protein